MTTSEHSTQLRFEDVYESFQVDSLVSHLVVPESEKGQPTIGICSPKCYELYQRLAPIGSWARMFAVSLVGQVGTRTSLGWYSTRSSLTWKVQVTKCSRPYFLLAASTLRTAEIESSSAPDGLLLTPTTREDAVDLEVFQKRMEKYPNGTTMPNLATQVQGMLPTPTAQDGKNASFPSSQEKRGSLIGKLYPTVTARCFNNGTDKERPEGQPSRRSELNHMIAQDLKNGTLPTPSAADGHKTTSANRQKNLNMLAPVGTGSQLSPRFVAEMMGFPHDWTELPFRSGDENQ
jgi:hypothetical protein